MVNALRKLLCMVALLNLGGCAATLIPSNEGGSFVLEEDILYSMKIKFTSTPPMRGLTRGEYIAVGHNSDGIFYRGPRGCVLFFTQPDGAHYLKTGERRLLAPGDPLSAAPDDEGGVFIPYDPTEEPYFFVYQDWRGHTGEAEAEIPPRPHSDVNTYKGEPAARESIPFRPAKVVVVNLANPGGLPSPGAALGGAIALHAGRAAAMPLISRVQGKPLLTASIDDENLQALLRKVMREQRHVRSSFDPVENELAGGNGATGGR